MGEVVLGFMISAHVALGDNYNNKHPSITYRKEDYVVGVYQNSYSRPSLYGGYVKNIDGFEVYYGAATGYVLPVVPFVAVKRELEKNIKFVVIPSFDVKHKNPGMVLGIELTIKE